MKKYLLLIVLIIASVNKSVEKTPKINRRILEKKQVCTSDTTYIYGYRTVYTEVFGTVYHAVQEQCDDTPLITADGSTIDTTRVNDLRWVALSRDLLKFGAPYNWNGKIKFGDTIYVESNDHRINGAWVVRDSMGKYYWQPQAKLKPSDITKEMLDTKEYKIKSKHVFKKFYQNKWVDFLQDPKTGFNGVWNKRNIKIKKKVTTGYNVTTTCSYTDSYYVVN